ncbi:fumarylacetoacetate hydrolase family protein [Prauserella muralis]|uniref:Fumarylacetoacetate hydrolase n=1 Tax=Prauserella muralis TaxID=588067 RepID=A0A2V4APH8_9PSEU|nr:fumarylacetoacetate hydrolase family protein [Prauserella muralis]PXY22610.1 fumarylacetoacetate hydrolase [Prauserella muralis]TWE28314.1 2-dehydro-3-deoxy-D-arabinonate dehydratase [Prauserella muralis]
MEIVRYADGTGRTRIGLRQDDTVTPVDGVDSLAQLWRRPVAALREDLRPDPARAVPASGVRLLPPVDERTEVWAAGVTYERSRGARVEESTEATVYERVYDAPRPEVFFKAPAWRVVTDGDPVALREGSTLDVPEPELALVVNSEGEIAGLTVCNDMSSRSIEGENPLYLPQAKIYNSSCALATGIRPVWEVADPENLAIRMAVLRDGAIAWEGETSTARLHRPLREMVATLYQSLDFPDGAVLATGTGIVPELSFTLVEGDRVDIEIESVGSLSNPVVKQDSGAAASA